MTTPMLPAAASAETVVIPAAAKRLDSAYAMFAYEMQAALVAEETTIAAYNRTLHVLDVRNAVAEQDKATIAPKR